jgi:hypothetical protein
VRVVGIDEDSALVGGLDGWDGEPAAAGTTWRVHGRQSVWLLEASGRRQVASGLDVVLGHSPKIVVK